MASLRVDSPLFDSLLSVIDRVRALRPSLRADSPLVDFITLLIPLVLFNTMVSHEEEGYAIQLLRRCRKLVRETPDLATPLGAPPKKRQGRPPGRRSIKPFESLIIAWLVDVAGLNQAQVLRVVRRWRGSDPNAYRWLRRRLELGSYLCEGIGRKTGSVDFSPGSEPSRDRGGGIGSGDRAGRDRPGHLLR